MITNRGKLRFLDETTDSARTVKERKKAFRSSMKERRANNENRDVKELLMVENFFRGISETYGDKGSGKRYFVYLSFSSEASTDKLIEALIKRGNEVYAPRMENGELVAVRLGEDFTVNGFGIREPIGESFQGETDYVVLPLLAVDEKGNRLGYGGGWYDRYLHKHKTAKRIAFCYDFQLRKEIPREETDERVDLIVTELRTMKV